MQCKDYSIIETKIIQVVKISDNIHNLELMSLNFC